MAIAAVLWVELTFGRSANKIANGQYRLTLHFAGRAGKNITPCHPYAAQ
jgi:hypothetical protein